MTGSPLSVSAMETFHWHPASVAHGPRGERRAAGDVRPLPGESVLVVPGSDPGTLVRVFGAGAAGRPFRVSDRGGSGEAFGPVFQCESGGTTAVPKVIERTQRSWILTFERARAWHRGPAERVAIPGRLSHSLSLYGALEGLHLGADIDLLHGIRPDRMVAAMAERQATLVWCTPAQIRQMALSTSAAPTVRRLMVGGAALDAATRAGAQTLFPGAEIVAFYGATELSFVAIADGTTPPDAAGRPYPGVEIAIRDADGAPCADGVTGEIWVRSPYLFDRYAAGEGTARRDGDWFSIGDLGHLDEGCLWLHGRSSRWVAIADQTISLDAVEGVIIALPGVHQAAVVALPDPLRGHRLAALVQGETGGVAAACRAAFGPVAAPKQVIPVADWPTLPSGKTDLRALERLVP